MSVVAELRVRGGEFELGRILGPVGGLRIELETIVPLGEQPVPLLVVDGEACGAFESRVEDHPSVDRLAEVERHDGEVLYALDWDASRDRLLDAMAAVEAHLVTGGTTEDVWAFEVRFPSREALSRFDQRCREADVDVTVDRIHDPTEGAVGERFGLTERQRETLVRAVASGYYDIPRRRSTADLAEEFGVSDQAITERLRRGIVTLVENTLVVPEVEDEE
jgi:predicted DNA binding protein